MERTTTFRDPSGFMLGMRIMALASDLVPERVRAIARDNGSGRCHYRQSWAGLAAVGFALHSTVVIQAVVVVVPLLSHRPHRLRFLRPVKYALLAGEIPQTMVGQGRGEQFV